MGKSRFEKWLWGGYGIEVSHYHGYNEIFTYYEYRKYCDDKGKTQSVSVIVAHYQS